MKLSSLFKTPLSYRPLSESAPAKREKAMKATPPARKPQSGKAKKPVQLKPYRGISIAFDERACDAVKAIGGRRFLVTEGDAPMLPLPSCDASRCNCKYRHHDDRREEQHDRRLTVALRTDLYEDSGNENRRANKRGRRKSDT